MILLTREDEIRAESLAKGRVEGEQKMQHSIYERLVAYGMSPQEASAMTGWKIKINSVTQ